jgi:SAM-dependent methyltransferase
MRKLDCLLQQWRVRVARPWIPSGASVLDIGCHQGELFDSLSDQIGPSVGLDPLAPRRVGSRHRLFPEPFRAPAPFSDGTFDAVVMLATLEHIRDKAPLAQECHRLLRPEGRVVITVPSRRVDGIVALLCLLGLADGMSLDEHHGFDPRDTTDLFTRQGFRLECHHCFQFGLNHLFVFRKTATAPVRRRTIPVATPTP